MSKIKEKIKNGILKENWDYVCDAYFLLTGEKISPPKKSVDINSFNKRNLYDYLKKDCGMNFLLPIGEYKIEDLRLIYEYRDTPQESGGQDFEKRSNWIELEYGATYSDIGETNASPQPEYTFISNKKAARALNIDKKPIDVVLRDFPTYGDEKRSTTSRTRTRQTVSARCRKCNKVSKINPAIAIRGTDNEQTYICEGCG